MGRNGGGEEVSSYELESGLLAFAVWWFGDPKFEII